MRSIAEQHHPKVPYAGLVTRAVALIFDLGVINLGLALLAGITGLLLSSLNESLNNDLRTLLAGAACWLAVVVVYFLTFWTSVGQTPGMRLMGIVVVPLRGERIRIRQGLRRLVGMGICILTLGLGYLPVLFNRRRQGLHDRLAGTVVLYEEDAEGLLSLPPAKHLGSTAVSGTDIASSRKTIDRPRTDPEILP